MFVGESTEERRQNADEQERDCSEAERGGCFGEREIRADGLVYNGVIGVLGMLLAHLAKMSRDRRYETGAGCGWLCSSLGRVLAE